MPLIRKGKRSLMDTGDKVTVEELAVWCLWSPCVLIMGPMGFQSLSHNGSRLESCFRFGYNAPPSWPV
jgi:hypothetical protein